MSLDRLTIGDDACTQDYICNRFGKDIRNGGDVSIATDTCTNITTDVCGTNTTIGGKATCDGGGCPSGADFILLSNTITDCNLFCA
mmetsp:Transcript_21080/g.60163  ORF Transcript_21080/g.60163 Transcript_21080/m.60163 type:complete len:86 (+) Transcript_21080:2587-2844(+)